MNISKKIEVLANIAILVTASLLCVVLVKNHLAPASKSANNQPTIKTNAAQNNYQLKSGMKLSLEGMDWSKNGRTLLLALSTTCHFCSESGPFYRRLLKERGGNTSVVAVLPQAVNDGNAYMKRLGISVDEVKQVPLNSLGVAGTPTLILVDNEGVIIDSWVGRLPESEEYKVVDRVRQNIAQK
jgi:thioredoxin-related protein